MTLEEALLIADDGPHAFNQSWNPAIARLAAEVRRQHAELERLRQILDSADILDEYQGGRNEHAD